jgi:hypothetical protein
MKTGFEYIFVIIAFIAVIALSSYGSAIVPYQKDDLFSKQFVYEGLENSNTDTMENTDDKKKDDSTNFIVPDKPIGTKNLRRHTVIPSICSHKGSPLGQRLVTTSTEWPR